MMEITNAYKLIADKLQAWIDIAIQMLPNLVVALLVMIIFYVIGKLVRKTVSKLLYKTTNNKTIIHLLETIVGVLIIGIGFFIALGVLNLSGVVNKFLAGAGIVGLALGFAFQDIASNFISGVILSIRHPFGIGDIIETNDYYGTVQRLNLRNTILRTPQGQTVYIPNKIVFENPLLNFTKSGERRIDLECGVSYGDDLTKARDLTVKAIEGLDCFNKDRDVEFYYKEFGGSSVNFVVRFWVNFQRNPDFWSPRSEAIMAIKRMFDENDIMIPFPIRTLDFGIRGGETLQMMLEDGQDKQKETDSE